MPPTNSNSSADSLPGICQHVRNLYKEKWFPKLDEEGVVHTAHGVGRASKANRTQLRGTTLKKYLQKHFPHRHVHYVPDAVQRALKQKQSGGTRGQLTLSGMMTATWTQDNMMRASKEFQVPTGTKILLAFPDTFDRDILEKIPEFQVHNEEGEVVGVKTSCPKHRCQLLKHRDKCPPTARIVVIHKAFGLANLEA